MDKELTRIEKQILKNLLRTEKRIVEADVEELEQKNNKSNIDFVNITYKKDYILQIEKMILKL